LRYVLSIESSKGPSWLDLRALTEAVDRYAAAHGTGDKPRAFAVGQSQTYSKPSGMFVTPSKPLPPRTSVSAVGAGRGSSHAGSTRRCFNCGSTDHLQAACPGVKKPSSGGHAGVKRVGVDVAQRDQTCTVSVVQEKQVCDVDSTSQLSIGAPTAGTAANDIDNTATVPRVANTETCDMISPVSMLKYIDVCITSDDSSVTKYTNALCDSGAEICVIKSSLICDLPVDVVGQI